MPRLPELILLMMPLSLRWLRLMHDGQCESFGNAALLLGLNGLLHPGVRQVTAWRSYLPPPGRSLPGNHQSGASCH